MPYCFIAIPFKMKKELDIIKKALNRLKIKPIVANERLPQFLFHDICVRISKAMIGVFEVTEANENVFAEYGIMVGHGKPAILLYNTKKRQELKSDFRGIIQTHYENRRDISSALSSAISSSSWKMVSPDGSVLQTSLFSRQMFDNLRKAFRKARFKIKSAKLEIERTKNRDRGDYLSFFVEVEAHMQKGNVNFVVKLPMYLGANKSRVRVGVRRIEGASFASANLRRGHPLSDQLKMILREIQKIWMDTVNSVEHSFLHP
jgi:hypothetical protein